MQGGMSVRGAVSGFEVDEVLEQLMELERQPIERMEQQGQEILEKQEVWREVDSRAREFQNALRPMRERWNFLQREATSSDESVVTAVAEEDAEEATYDIDVKQLATSHSVGTSEGYADPGEALGINGDFFLDTGADVTELEEDLASENDWLEGDISTGFYTQGVTDTQSLEVETLELNEEEQASDADRIDVYAHSFTDVEGNGQMQELQEYFEQNHDIDDFDLEEPLLTLEKNENDEWEAYDQGGNPFEIHEAFPDGILELEAEFIESGENEGEEEILQTRQFDFRHGEDAVNQQRISINETDSLEEIVEQINHVSEHTGVRASVVMKAEGDHRLVLESEEEGTDGKIQAWSQDNVLDELQLDQELVEAQDAEFEFNGMNIERTSNTVDDLVDGVDFHLEGKGEATVSVDTDTDRPREMIENFIDTYNDFNSILRQVQEDDEDDPLLEEEEEEGVQERGALRGDTTLQRIESRLRSTIHGHVPEIEEGETPFNSLAEIGISAGAPSTEEQDYMESAEGFLEITDEEALDQALRDDPEGVFELFGRRAPEDEDGNPKGPDGIARQMNEFLDSVVGPDGMSTNRQDELSRQVSDLEERMERVEQRAQRRKEHMIQQFTAMERHINRMQGEDMAMGAIGDTMDTQQAAGGAGGEEE